MAAPSPPRSLTSPALESGTLALAARDRRLADIVTRLGVPPMWGRRPGYATLVHIILEQQVSIAAARTLFRRLSAQLGGVRPETVLAAGVEGLRARGLTRQKSAYCHGLAERVLDGRLDLSAVARSAEPHGRAALLAVPGLGPWSVDIYWLMALRRPDVWPRGDLALAVAMQDVLGLRTRPDPARQLRIARDWAPWRSVAARLLWAHYLQARGQYVPSRPTTPP
jgi:DNA-3-methyladenine glycosylase II